MSDVKTLNMVVAALGGEGGGVLSNWLIDVAERENWMCQSTSLAGVAQRTGATIYYLEMFPRSAVIDGKLPVMSLFPAQGDIDVAIASEVAEAARMVQRGFVTPERTALIASDHRVYGITEKENLGDGIVDAEALKEIAARYAKQYIHYDMLALANEHATVISATLLGAIAGSAELPFSKQSFEDVIRATGKAVNNNLAAFNASFERAQSQLNTAVIAPAPSVEVFDPVPVGIDPSDQEKFVLPQGSTAQGRELIGRVKGYPQSCQEVLFRALEKLIDYQDYDYAHQYLDEFAIIVATDRSENAELSCELARYLALWMCYEDIPRVAQLKIRASRMETVRDEVKAEPGQLFDLTEFFRPRLEEISAILPVKIGLALEKSTFCHRLFERFIGGKQLRTNTISVYLTLRTLAGCRRWRRRSLGYQHEHEMIQRWLNAVRDAVGRDLLLARELVECGRLVKGYGDTRARTSGQIKSILTRYENGELRTADQVSNWLQAALADDEGVAFGRMNAA